MAPPALMGVMKRGCPSHFEPSLLDADAWTWNKLRLGPFNGDTAMSMVVKRPPEFWGEEKHNAAATC
jgi:hypothetical protein